MKRSVALLLISCLVGDPCLGTCLTATPFEKLSQNHSASIQPLFTENALSPVARVFPTIESRLNNKKTAELYHTVTPAFGIVPGTWWGEMRRMAIFGDLSPLLTDDRFDQEREILHKRWPLLYKIIMNPSPTWEKRQKELQFFANEMGTDVAAHMETDLDLNIENLMEEAREIVILAISARTPGITNPFSWKKQFVKEIVTLVNRGLDQLVYRHAQAAFIGNHLDSIVPTQAQLNALRLEMDQWLEPVREVLRIYSDRNDDFDLDIFRSVVGNALDLFTSEHSVYNRRLLKMARWAGNSLWRNLWLRLRGENRILAVAGGPILSHALCMPTLQQMEKKSDQQEIEPLIPSTARGWRDLPGSITKLRGIGSVEFRWMEDPYSLMNIRYIQKSIDGFAVILRIHQLFKPTDTAPTEGQQLYIQMKGLYIYTYASHIRTSFSIDQSLNPENVARLNILEVAASRRQAMTYYYFDIEQKRKIKEFLVSTGTPGVWDLRLCLFMDEFGDRYERLGRMYLDQKIDDFVETHLSKPQQAYLPLPPQKQQPADHSAAAPSPAPPSSVITQLENTATEIASKHAPEDETSHPLQEQTLPPATMDTTNGGITPLPAEKRGRQSKFPPRTNPIDAVLDIVTLISFENLTLDANGNAAVAIADINDLGLPARSAVKTFDRDTLNTWFVQALAETPPEDASALPLWNAAAPLRTQGLHGFIILDKSAAYSRARRRTSEARRETAEPIHLPALPVIETFPGDIVTTTGRRINLYATVRGDDVHYEWAISTDEDHWDSLGSGQQISFIARKAQDGATIVCGASNAGGKAERRLRLTVDSRSRTAKRLNPSLGALRVLQHLVEQEAAVEYIPILLPEAREVLRGIASEGTIGSYTSLYTPEVNAILATSLSERDSHGWTDETLLQCRAIGQQLRQKGIRYTQIVRANDAGSLAIHLLAQIKPETFKDQKEIRFKMKQVEPYFRGLRSAEGLGADPLFLSELQNQLDQAFKSPEPDFSTNAPSHFRWETAQTLRQQGIAKIHLLSPQRPTSPEAVILSLLQAMDVDTLSPDEDQKVQVTLTEIRRRGWLGFNSLTRFSTELLNQCLALALAPDPPTDAVAPTAMLLWQKATRLRMGIKQFIISDKQTALQQAHIARKKNGSIRTGLVALLQQECQFPGFHITVNQFALLLDVSQNVAAILMTSLVQLELVELHHLWRAVTYSLPADLAEAARKDSSLPGIVASDNRFDDLNRTILRPPGETSVRAAVQILRAHVTMINTEGPPRTRSDRRRHASA